MTKRLLTLALLVLILYAVGVSAQGNGYNAARQATFITTGSDITLQQNSLIAYHEIIWTPNASVATCTASVDSSVDGVTWTTGGIITSKNCASSGNTGIPSAAVQANFIRLTILTLTGTNASVTIQYEGWAYAPAGSSGGGSLITGAGGSCNVGVLADGVICTGALGSTVTLDDNNASTATGITAPDGSTLEVGGGVEALDPAGHGLTISSGGVGLGDDNGDDLNMGGGTATLGNSSGSQVQMTPTSTIFQDPAGDTCGLTANTYTCTLGTDIWSQAASGVVYDSATGGAKGSGTINTKGCFVNGVACLTSVPGGIFESGWASSTPAGTQFFSAVGRQGVLTAGAAANFAVVPRAITITGISANVTAAEGAAATIAITLDTCTTSACTAVNTTLATCTIGNSASICSATGLSVAITAGQLIVAQTVQTGTGTAQVGGVGFTYN